MGRGVAISLVLRLALLWLPQYVSCLFLRLRSTGLCIGVTLPFAPPKPGQSVRLEHCDWGGRDFVKPELPSLDQEFELRDLPALAGGRVALALTNYPTLCLAASGRFVKVMSCAAAELQSWTLRPTGDGAFAIEGPLLTSASTPCLSVAATPMPLTLLKVRGACDDKAAFWHQWEMVFVRQASGRSARVLRTVKSAVELQEEQLSSSGYGLRTLLACAVSCAAAAAALTALMMRSPPPFKLPPSKQPATQPLPLMAVGVPIHDRKEPCPICLVHAPEFVTLACSHKLCVDCSAQVEWPCDSPP